MLDQFSGLALIQWQICYMMLNKAIAIDIPYLKKS
jgi:hypothetical protein